MQESDLAELVQRLADAPAHAYAIAQRLELYAVLALVLVALVLVVVYFANSRRTRLRRASPSGKSPASASVRSSNPERRGEQEEYAPVNFAAIQALPQDRIQSYKDERGKNPYQYRVCNLWNSSGKSSKRWFSKDYVIALQSTWMDHLELREDVEYRVAVSKDGKVISSFLAYIARRTAAEDFSGQSPTFSDISYPLAVGFNSALVNGEEPLQRLNSPDGKLRASYPEQDLVTLEITEIRGWATFAQALRGTHPNADINISTLFLLIAVPMGFMSSIGTDVLDQFTDRGADKDWVIRAVWFVLGIALSGLTVGLCRGWFRKPMKPKVKKA